MILLTVLLLLLIWLFNQNLLFLFFIDGTYSFSKSLLVSHFIGKVVHILHYSTKKIVI